MENITSELCFVDVGETEFHQYAVDLLFGDLFFELTNHHRWNNRHPVFIAKYLLKIILFNHYSVHRADFHTVAAVDTAVGVYLGLAAIDSDCPGGTDHHAAGAAE